MQVEVLDGGGDLRHELHGRGPGPNDAHPLSRQVETVLPASGMKDLAAEGVETRKVRDGGLAQRAGRPHQHRRAVLLAPRRADDPAGGGVVPARLLHFSTESQERAHIETVHALADVVPDFALRGERTGPLRIEREGERVEVGGDVARGAGVGVVAPGAAEVVAAVEDDEVVDAHGAQAGRHPDAGEPGTDDDDAVLVAHGVEVTKAATTSASSSPQSSCRKCPPPTIVVWGCPSHRRSAP